MFCLQHQHRLSWFCIFVLFYLFFFFFAGESSYSLSVFIPVLSEGQNVTSRRDHRAKIRPVNDQRQLGSTFHKAIVMTVSLWQLSCWNRELGSGDWEPSERPSSHFTFCLITPSSEILFPIWWHSSSCNVVIRDCSFTFLSLLPL